MGLNIKTDEAHRLAKRLAKETGESMTKAVTTALRERLERVERRGLADELMKIARSCAEHLKKAPGKRISIEDLYDDETGLPK
ncbi:MAG: type II toxin-antitoxin system VapB family antitoxin [Rhizomicrobium sp.]